MGGGAARASAAPGRAPGGRSTRRRGAAVTRALASARWNVPLLLPLLVHEVGEEVFDLLFLARAGDGDREGARVEGGLVGVEVVIVRARQDHRLVGGAAAAPRGRRL